jgi:cytochrome b561
LRLDRGLRLWTYATFTALLVTGAVWLVADPFKASDDGESWQAVAATMLMLHGIAAMIALVLLGMLIPLHVRRSWRMGKNRISGAAMVAANAVLVATASGLYYAGADLLRAVVVDVHVAIGILLPTLMVTHIIAGRRARTPVRRTQSAPVEMPAALRAVTFSEDRGFR